MKYIRRTNTEITSNFLINLLKDRGIIPTGYEKEFFYPDEVNELPAANLDHMQEGYEMLRRHIKEGNKIYLIVDCD